MGAAPPGGGNAGGGRGRAAASILVLAACAAALAVTLTYPMTVDQGVFAYLGQGILEGRWPYVHAFESDFPGLMFLQALEILIFGESVLGFRVFDLLWQLATAWVIYRLTAHVAGNRSAGLLAAVLYCLVYQSYGPWNTAQREGFATLFVLGGFLLYLTRGRRPAARTAFGVGLSLGLAALVKPTLVLLGALYLPLAPGLRRGGWRAAGRGLAGAALPALAVVAFYAWQGGLRELYEATIAYQEIYSGMVRGDRSLPAFFVGNLTELGGSSLALAAGFVPFLVLMRERREAWMLYLGYLAALVGVALQGTFAGYHYLPGMGLGAVLVGVSFAEGSRRVLGGLAGWSGEGLRRARRGAAALLLAGAVPLYVEGEAAARLASLDLAGPPDGWAYRNDGVFDYGESWRLAAHLRERTEAREPILVWGYEPLVYYLAERHPPTRFHTTHPLVERGASGELSEMQRRWRREFMADVRRHPPAFVAVVREDDWWWSPDRMTSRELLSDFPAWREFLEANYRRDGEIGRFLVYRRADDAPSGSSGGR